MKTNRAIAFLFICLGLACFPACRATLEPGGAYAPMGQQADMAFYAVDGAFDLAYSMVDAAFKFENDNRASLWKFNPKIKQTLDKIRPEAAKLVVKYATARTAYLKFPTPSGLTDLQLALAEIQKLSAAATAIIPKGK